MAVPSIAMAGLSLVKGAMQYQQAGQQASAARAAAEQNARAQVAEDERVAGQYNDQAAQATGDRADQAARQASTLRVLMGERGASANAQSRSMQELGYFEGMDLSRIEQSREAHIQAIGSQENATQVELNNQFNTIGNQESTARTGAFLGTLGSFVQIGANDYADQKWEHLQVTKNPDTFEYKFPWQR